MRMSRGFFGPPPLANIDDLRLRAQRRLPKVVFDYLDGGAEGEVTLRANRSAFDSVTFRPRHAIPITECNLQTSVLKKTLSLPILLAPIAHSNILHPRGELAAARAAGSAGTAYVLSTLSEERLEDVRDCSNGPVWYQLYLWGGREAAEAAIERSAKAGIRALVVTIDSIVGGKRERDIRNRAEELWTRDLLASLPFLFRLMARPGWLTDYLRHGGMPRLANVIQPGQENGLVWKARYQAVTWQDLSWIRETWKGPLLIKGILTADDARRSLDEGADALVVSNHGGRQLDGVPSSLEALAEVVEAVGTRTEILMDGGIRRGSDVIKAICLGARAVLCGRAFAYGLASSGEAGVTTALSILRVDLERTMKLLGCTSISELNRSYINK